MELQKNTLSIISVVAIVAVVGVVALFMSKSGTLGSDDLAGQATGSVCTDNDTQNDPIFQGLA